MYQYISDTANGYGLATFVKAHAGRREALVDVLADVSRLVHQSPGCLDYTISRVPENEDAVFITEYWSGRNEHRAMLELPGMFELLDRCAELIEQFEQTTLEPVA